ncbi:MAG: hypothetical protein ACO3I0_06065 [Limisphaerales bacterium]
MNTSSVRTLMTGALLALGVCLQPLTAQDAPSGNPGQGQGRGQGGGGGGGGGGRQRGNFDPEQMRQQIMTRYREQLGIKDDAEWGVIEGRINKINEARRNSGRGFGGFGGRGGGPGGPGGAGGGQGGRGGWGGQPSPEAEALQRSLDGGASADDVKAKLAAYRASQKQKEATLEKAQDELRQVLSVKQEAPAVLMGLLK